MRVKLEEVCERGSSNLMQKDVSDCPGEYPIFGAAGQIGCVDFYHQERPYVAVVKDGAGIGRTILLPAKSSVIGTMQYLLPKENVLPDYLCYVVQYMHLEKYSSGATIPHIYFRDYKNEEFNLSSLDEQAGIVKTLNGVADVIEKRRQQLSNLDVLIKARFVEMFGDPILNPLGWSIKRFDEISENLDSRRKPVTSSDRKEGIYPYYGASGIVDYVEDYIFDEDILLISEDGANLLMRSTPIAFSVSGKVWVNNHAHVVRFKNISTQNYVEKYFSLIDITDSITGSAQPKLNQANLNAMLIPIPEKSLLDSYLDVVKQVNKSKAVVQVAHVIARNLHSRRQQKCRILNF